LVADAAGAEHNERHTAKVQERRFVGLDAEDSMKDRQSAPIRK
jgi:hypothetical protein